MADAGEADDLTLLRQYANDRREDAFTAIVRRHIDVVYAAALRRTRDAEMAQDVTQAVFIMLATRAGRIRPGTILAGWLYNASRYAAANARKLERRRQIHECRAAAMPRTEPRMDSMWHSVEPVLEEAMDSLRSADRDILLLRYFRGHSTAQMGEMLGIAENTAAKRVSRALDRLRAALSRRGVTASTPALAGMLVSDTAHPAPSALVAAASSLAATSSSATATGIAKGALIMGSTQKAATAVVIVAALLSFSGAGLIAFYRGRSSSTPVEQVAIADPAPTRRAAKNAALSSALPEIKFDAVPFADVIDFLRDVSGANFFVDWTELERAGLARTTPITARFSNVTLGDALNGILGNAPGGARYMLGLDGDIEISTGPGTARLKARQEWIGPVLANSRQLRFVMPEPRFETVPIAEAVDFFKGVLSGRLGVDWSDLKTKGIDPTTPVSLHMKQIRTAAVLELLLYQASKPEVHLVTEMNNLGEVRIIATQTLTPPATQSAN